MTHINIGMICFARKHDVKNTHNCKHTPVAVLLISWHFVISWSCMMRESNVFTHIASFRKAMFIFLVSIPTYIFVCSNKMKDTSPLILMQPDLNSFQPFFCCSDDEKKHTRGLKDGDIWCSHSYRADDQPKTGLLYTFSFISSWLLNHQSRSM